MTPLPLWLLNALEDIGVHELSGDAHHERIVEYHSNTGKWSRDEVPWCGSAVETWLLEAGEQGLGRKGALARSWWVYGSKCGPELGAITTIRRRKKGPDRRTGSRRGWHVGFYLNHSRGGIAMVSGNASDRVGVDVYSSRSYEVMAYRWPW